MDKPEHRITNIPMPANYLKAGEELMARLHEQQFSNGAMEDPWLKCEECGKCNGHHWACVCHPYCNVIGFSLAITVLPVLLAGISWLLFLILQWSVR